MATIFVDAEFCLSLHLRHDLETRLLEDPIFATNTVHSIAQNTSPVKVFEGHIWRMYQRGTPHPPVDDTVPETLIKLRIILLLKWDQEAIRSFSELLLREGDGGALPTWTEDAPRTCSGLGAVQRLLQ